MLPTPNFTASSLPVSGTITRAGADAPFTHGFGTLLQQEHDLQTCTADSVGAVTGPNAPALTRMLRYQQTRIGANITLLQQRHETLPQPARFRTMVGGRRPLAGRAADHPDTEPLAQLVAGHRDALESIEQLTASQPDGQRGDLILAAVARNHEEMAWMLRALAHENDQVRDLEPVPIVAQPATLESAPIVAGPVAVAESRWENEGGPARAAG
jgi:hypothetical protein